MEIMTEEEYKALVEGDSDEKCADKSGVFHYWRIGRVILCTGIIPGLQARIFTDEDIAKRVMQVYKNR